jgi:hypothetical protein
MRKLKLEIDELRVESFETAGVREASGTVRGRIKVMPASDEEECGGGGSGGDSGYQSCPCTLKYTCPDGCSNNCSLSCSICQTYAAGCC